MSYRIPLLVAILLCAPLAAQAAPATPAFTVYFAFKPTLDGKPGSVPAVSLDVCKDSSCSTVEKSIPLTCSVANNAAGTSTFVKGCSVHVYQPAVSKPGSYMTLLGQAADLRLKVNATASAPFHFAGGQPATPSKFYKFTATPGANGLAVTAAQ